MYTMSRSVYTETAHMLINHQRGCSNVHGHSYKWTVTLEAADLVKDMVMDFGQLKEIMEEVILPYDHILLVDQKTFDTVISPEMKLVMKVVVYPVRPTAENMARIVWQKIGPMLPPGVRVKHVTLRETENNEVTYEE